MRLLDWEGAKEDSYYANFHTFPSEELLETKREIAATKAKFLRQTFSPLIAPDCEDDLSTDHYNEKFRNRLEVTIQIDDHGEIYSVVMFVRGHLRQSDFQVYAIDSPSTSSVGNQFIALLFKFIQVSNGDQCMINGGRRCVNEGVGKEPRRIVYRRYL